jgi:hypothetical protein
MALDRAPSRRVLPLNPGSGGGAPGRPHGVPSIHSEYVTEIMEGRT